MGWGSGSEVAADVWDLVKKYIPPQEHREVARGLVTVFESYDCDTLQDAEELWHDAGNE